MNAPIKFVLLGLAGLLAGVLCFFLLVRKPQPVVSPVPPARQPGKKAVTPVLPVKTASVKRPGKKPPRPPSLVKKPASSYRDHLSPELAAEEFRSQDLVGQHATVQVAVSNSQARVGEVFTVTITATAPPLMNFSLLMEYDPTRVAYVPKSARGEKFFRYGIEFYARKKMKRMILLNAGNPGSRNTLRADRMVIAKFQLRALSAGKADLSFPKKGTILLNAFGKPLKTNVTGGRIMILP